MSTTETDEGPRVGVGLSQLYQGQQVESPHVTFLNFIAFL